MKMGHVGSLHSTLDSSFFFAMLFCITTGIDIYWKVKMGSLCTRRSVLEMLPFRNLLLTL